MVNIYAIQRELFVIIDRWNVLQMYIIHGAAYNMRSLYFRFRKLKFRLFFIYLFIIPSSICLLLFNHFIFIRYLSLRYISIYYYLAEKITFKNWKIRNIRVLTLKTGNAFRSYLKRISTLRQFDLLLLYLIDYTFQATLCITYTLMSSN